MADDTNFRSYRPGDQRSPSQAAPAAGSRESASDRSDPLAELARLIGQTDPFADMGQAVPRANAAASRQSAAGAMPQPPMHSPPPAAPSYPNDPYAHDPYGAPLQGNQFAGWSFGSHGPGEPRQEGFQPAYDPAIYGTPQPQSASGYPSQAYYEDPSRMPQGDEAYDQDFSGEERPRRGLKMVLAVVAVAILGTSVALGYRALFGSSGSSGPPPVIKASNTPSKVAPAPGSGDSNKLIYDRVGDAGQGEKVVSREEKPVDVKDTSRPPPRVVFPGMSQSQSAQDSTMALASPPLGDTSVGPASAEPKKIRTVTIRPDQPMPGAPAAAQRPNAPARTAAAPAAPSPFPPPPQQRTAPGPAQGSNAPLSLSPQVASAEPPSARPSPLPPPPVALAAPTAPTRVAALPPAADVGPGSYTVQISSQRSETEAQASFRSLQAKFPSILGDRAPIIRRADLGDRGIYFRAMVGPFASVDQATQFCGSLKSAGGQCVVQRN
jgi:hypothetical protein